MAPTWYPTGVLILLSIGFAVAQQFFFGIVFHAEANTIPLRVTSLASGILGCASNLLAAAVPFTLTGARGEGGIACGCVSDFRDIWPHWRIVMHSLTIRIHSPLSWEARGR